MKNAMGFIKSWEFLVFILINLVSIRLQFFLAERVNELGLLLFIAFNLVIVTLLFYIFVIRELEFYLIYVYLLQYIYMNNYFHYNIYSEVATAFPILLLFLLGISKYLQTKEINLEITGSFQIVLSIFLGYSFFSAGLGYYNGHESIQIFTELYRNLNYGSVFFFLMIFRKDDEYIKILRVLLAIVLIICAIYAVVKLANPGMRFVTFQSNIMPTGLAVGYAFYLYSKDFRSRLLAGSIGFISLMGTFLSLTRSLWVADMIIIGVITLFYMRFEKGYSSKTIRRLIFGAIIVLGVSATFIKPPKLTSKTIDNVSYRATSIFDPSRDMSFLMRIELNYYALLKFAESPIIGTGLGDFVIYKITTPDRSNQYFLDTSLIHFLWKGGIIGFLIYLILYIIVVRNAYYNAVKIKDPTHKLINLAIFASLLAFALHALFTPMLSKYKLNMILGFLFAYVEYFRLKLNSINEKDKELLPEELNK